ncbi:cobaltochelatase subunit CobN [Lichenicola sp.]|uniref:cobaltochelatase subunit CobN n=1 Tax=Lichenicola sp. TaxID=2804529 RepID=UPI003B00C7EB
MHLLVREIRTLDEQDQADDLAHAPADIVCLSFSDSDLATLAAAWQRLPDDAAHPRPTLRLANLARLRHPMSVDLYAEDTIAGSRCVLVRLLGGLDYWRYGAEELAATCRRHGVPLVLVPGDVRNDPRLAELSTVPTDMVSRLDGFLAEGGPDNITAALRLLAHLAGRGPDDGMHPAPVPTAGIHRSAPLDGRPRATILFYRSHLMAGDIAPFQALADALEARGLAPELIFAASLKDPAAAAFVADRLRLTRPRVVLNATFFSARHETAGSPLDAADAPVLQLVQAVAGEVAWHSSRRGLSQTDLAMQVVLPELDGRLLASAISFKVAESSDLADHAQVKNQPHAGGIALAADRAAGWARLAETPACERRVAIVLSDYPAIGGQIAHAVGLDSFASLSSILTLLREAGYETDTPPDADALTQLLCHAPATPFLSLAEYDMLFATLPATIRDATLAAWGPPDADPSVCDGQFSLRHARLGRLVLAVQPDRGSLADRRTSYHDPDTPARHGYLAFHLWLRHELDVHAMVHLGTHGTLEWLPGKATALSDDCLPVALLRGLPVIYPFIVNNPGEAAAAKRRLGAVTIGHLTPPIASAGSHGAALELERLIDDYAAADGLDRRRGEILRGEILDRAGSTGLLAESGANPGDDDADTLARLDAYLCDVKELQIRDGLHVFGKPPRHAQALLDGMCRTLPDADPAVLAAALGASPAAESKALLDALDGRFIQPGPAGAPTRGRADVLPTGRNLFSVDPRAIPTRAAVVLAEKAAAALLDRHRQDEGDWLRRVVIDLWGSTSLRTGGEDLALALLLMGVRPTWDIGSGRVSGFEIVPLAVLDRPRVDVTLRISGFFRDAFPAQIALFDQAVGAVAAREEDAAWNPLAVAHGEPAPSRIFGPAPGSYGTGVEDRLARGDWQQRDELGRAYLEGSGWGYGGASDGLADADGFVRAVTAAEALVHTQDHAETDLLDGLDAAAHEGGFAAAAAALGATPALYHADTSRPDQPRIRSVAEEVARVVRGRAANPAWIAGMMRHGYQGGAEIAHALDALHGFAATIPGRYDRQFELVFDATLGDAAVDGFLRAANPEARAAMAARFEEARARGLWQPRRNSIGVPAAVGA